MVVGKLRVGSLAVVVAAALVFPLPAAPEIELVFEDFRELAEKKARLRQGDAEARDEFRALMMRAERTMQEKPVSVANKERVPPSGDKRDYLSLAPYWWPDPKKDDGLPWIRKDGRVNPETRGEHGDRAVKNRFIEHVHTLCMASLFSSNPKYAERAVEWLEVWFVHPDTRMNPNLKYAQGVPGRSNGRCYGIIEWLNVDEVITPIQLLGAGGMLSPETDRAITRWFEEYAAWLQTSDFGREASSRKNNHATWYDVQLSGILLFLGRKDEARRILEQVKTRRIATQIEPDGRQPHELARTKSWSYSRMNLRGFMRLVALGRQVGVDLWSYETPDGRSIRKAAAFLAQYEDGKKKWPYPQVSK